MKPAELSRRKRQRLFVRNDYCRALSLSFTAGWGFMGSGAAGAFFAQNFMLLAITLGILYLISFVAAVRILL